MKKLKSLKDVLLVYGSLIFWGGLVAALIFIILKAERKWKCNISDGIHVARMEHNPPLKFVLSDYVVVVVKDSRLTKVLFDKRDSDTLSIRLEKDSSCIVKDGDGEEYSIKIIQ